MATTFAAGPRVTVVGEVLGRRLSELSYVQDVYQPHPLAGRRGDHAVAHRRPRLQYDAPGRPAPSGTSRGSWLLNTNLLIRVTDGGLRVARHAGRLVGLRAGSGEVPVKLSRVSHPSNAMGMNQTSNGTRNRISLLNT